VFEVYLKSCKTFSKFTVIVRGSTRVAKSLISIFTVQRYASAVHAVMFVCLSDTRQCSTKTAKPRITQTKPYDSPGTLVFMPKISAKIPTGSLPNKGGVGSDGRFSTKASLR